MKEVNIAFDNYIEEFKKISTKEKFNEIISSLKELITFFDFLATSENVNLKYLKSKELLDLKNENPTQDDYLEAILVYIEVSKNLIAQYLDPSILENSNK